MSVPDPTQSALQAVMAERHKQDAKWGVQDHSLEWWHLILAEETGELAQAILENHFGGPKGCNVRLEAVQVAAVALAIVECIDRNKLVQL